MIDENYSAENEISLFKIEQYLKKLQSCFSSAGNTTGYFNNIEMEEERLARNISDMHFETRNIDGISKESLSTSPYYQRLQSLYSDYNYYTLRDKNKADSARHDAHHTSIEEMQRSPELQDQLVKFVKEQYNITINGALPFRDRQTAAHIIDNMYTGSIVTDREDVLTNEQGNIIAQIARGRRDSDPKISMINIILSEEDNRYDAISKQELSQITYSTIQDNFSTDVAEFFITDGVKHEAKDWEKYKQCNAPMQEVPSNGGFRLLRETGSFKIVISEAHPVNDDSTYLSRIFTGIISYKIDDSPRHINTVNNAGHEEIQNIFQNMTLVPWDVHADESQFLYTNNSPNLGNKIAHILENYNLPVIAGNIINQETLKERPIIGVPIKQIRSLTNDELQNLLNDIYLADETITELEPYMKEPLSINTPLTSRGVF